MSTEQGKHTDKATPRPWCSKPTAGHDRHGQTAIYPEADGGAVAIVYNGDGDAALIVRAVNSHFDACWLLNRVVEVSLIQVEKERLAELDKLSNQIVQKRKLLFGENAESLALALAGKGE